MGLVVGGEVAVAEPAVATGATEDGTLELEDADDARPLSESRFSRNKSARISAALW